MFVLNVLASFLGCSITLGCAFMLVYSSRMKAIKRIKGGSDKCKLK